MRGYTSGHTGTCKHTASDLAAVTPYYIEYNYYKPSWVSFDPTSREVIIDHTSSSFKTNYEFRVKAKLPSPCEMCNGDVYKLRVEVYGTEVCHTDTNDTS